MAAESPLAFVMSWAGRHRRTAGWLLALLAVALCKWPTLLQPPAWDTAMGVFPPAVFLYRHGFDLAALAQQPGWLEAGPNLHVLSAVTWTIATVMWLTDDPQWTLGILHGLTWAITAAAGVCLYRLARPMVGPVAAALTCALTFFFPAVFVQAGYMYMEIPTMACAIAAVAAMARHRWTQAVLWAAVGAWIKLSILPVVAVLGMAALLAPRPWRHRIAMGVALLAVPATRLVLGRLFRRPTGDPWDMSYSVYLVDVFWHKLGTVPDIRALLAGVPLIGLWRWRAGLAALRRGNMSPGEVDPELARALLYGSVAMFVLFFVAAPLSGKGLAFLPRYAVVALPLCILAVVDLATGILPHRVALAGGVAALAMLLLNVDGRLYNPDSKSFAIAERSMQYRHFQDVQMAALGTLTAEAEDLPTWGGRGDVYMASDVMIGYVDRPLAHLKFVKAKPFRGWRLDDFPRHFRLLETNTWHGGKLIRRTLDEAREDERWLVTTRRFRAGPYSAALHELRWLLAGGGGEGSRKAAKPQSRNGEGG